MMEPLLFHSQMDRDDSLAKTFRILVAIEQNVGKYSGIKRDQKIDA